MIEKLKKLNSGEIALNITQKICYLTVIFALGAIIGYLYEVIFYLIADKELVNRGFLYGPYLPVYGFGAVLMLPILKRFKKNPLIIFFGAMFLTGIVEYATGYAMWEIYHDKWWDYTGLFLNINGYVCLRSVLTFAIGGLLLIYLIEPLIRKVMIKCEKFELNLTTCIIIATFLIDLMFTIMFRNKL